MMRMARWLENLGRMDKDSKVVCKNFQPGAVGFHIWKIHQFSVVNFASRARALANLLS